MSLSASAPAHFRFCSTSVRCDVEGRIGVVDVVVVNLDAVLANESVLTVCVEVEINK